MNYQRPMMFLIAVALLLAIVLLVAKINLSNNFGKEIKELFSQSKSISGKNYHQSDLQNLPQPVQRYFKYVLKDGQAYISYARITHNGQFKTGFDKEWINIEGEQYATTETPGFIWKGATFMFTARDMYIGGKGRLVVSLFSVYNVADAQGPQYDQGELLRWLGESILYPTNLLPGERLEWSSVESETANLTFKYKGIILSFVITFNEKGEIIRMETKRYMDENNLATWIIKVADYKEFNNVLIPTAFEVIWRLPKGDFTYAKFKIQKIEYDIPARF